MRNPNRQPSFTSSSETPCERNALQPGPFRKRMGPPPVLLAAWDMNGKVVKGTGYFPPFVGQGSR